jgi:outer membrane protein assembly factor BamB
MTMIRQRPLTSLLIFVAVLAVAATASVALTRPSVVGVGGQASASAVRATVTLQVRTIDGDKELRGAGAGIMAGVPVTVRDQSGASRTAISNGSGIATVTNVDAGGMITVSATAPRRYVTFPTTVAAQTVDANGGRMDVPLYRDDQQWLTWGRTNDRRRVGPPAGTPSGSWLWTTDPGNNVEFPPSLAYGMIVYGSYHGYLCADSQATGANVWREYPGDKWGRISKFANQVAVSSWVENGRRIARVFYADLSGIVGSRDLFTGAVDWEITAGKGNGTRGKRIPFKSIEASPLVLGKTVYICTRFNKSGSKAGLWALDRSSGKVRWFKALGRTSRSKIGSSPAYANGRLFVATYDGYVYALRSSNGKVLWRKKIGGQFYSTPAVSGTRLFIGNKSNGRVYCLSTRNGRVLWRTKRLGTSVHGSPAVYGGRIFVGAGNRFYALKASNGRQVWRKSTKKRIWGSASILKGVVYYSDFGHTYARTARKGALVWSAKVGRYSPVTATRHLIIVCDRKSFYAYRPKD